MGILRTLTRVMTLAAKCSEASAGASLFVELDPEARRVFLEEVENMARNDFYGASFGFYYAGSTVRTLKFIQVALAGFSHGHSRTSSLATFVFFFLFFFKKKKRRRRKRRRRRRKIRRTRGGYCGLVDSFSSFSFFKKTKTKKFKK